ncbi:MAG: hypothetical protein BWY32_03668 [bacterium ADurb.Bin243]|nr:MAG: hypothetical protein BWY32_03668 [bacterium ADurb.Bin243]
MVAQIAQLAAVHFGYFAVGHFYLKPERGGEFIVELHHIIFCVKVFDVYNLLFFFAELVRLEGPYNVYLVGIISEFL